MNAVCLVMMIAVDRPTPSSAPKKKSVNPVKSRDVRVGRFKQTCLEFGRA